MKQPSRLVTLWILVLSQERLSDAFTQRLHRPLLHRSVVSSNFAVTVETTPDVPLEYNVDDNNKSNSNNNKDDADDDDTAGRSLLQDSFLEDATRILLDTSAYPPGTLPPLILSSAFHILHSWARTHSVHGANKVDRLLTRLEEEIQANPSATTLELSNKHYTAAVQAWGQSGHPQAAQRAEDVLNRMEHLASTSNPKLAPNRVAFNVVMSAYVKQGDLTRVLELLERMRATPGVQPQTNDYNMLLAAYGQLGLARKSEDILKRMVDQCREDNSNASEPDLFSYNMLLDAWAKSGEAGAGERAQEILTMLQERCLSGESSLQPDVRTFSHVANAVIRSGGAAENVAAAQNILEQAEAMGITPDVYLHSTLLDAYASSSERGAAVKAEERLNAMEQQGMANSVAYNTVIKAWKQSPDEGAAKRAEALLKRMEDLNMADTISYTTVIAAYGIKGDKPSAIRAEELYERMAKSYEQGNMYARPNTQTLNALMNAWVKCGNVTRAEQILLRMEQSSYESGLEQAVVAPNVVSYSTVMNGWAKSGDKDAVAKVEHLFDRMTKMHAAGNRDARPNLFAYTSLIDVISKSGTPDAPQKAQDIVFMMYNEYKKGHNEAKPNAQIITSLIDCWQKSGDVNAAERADAIFNWMINVSKKENDPSLEPNEYTFSAVISAWGKSRRFGKAARARAILQTMIDLHESGQLQAKPNTHCFTAVINCCAYSEKEASEKRAALQIAVDTFHELCQKPQYGIPNQVTYSSLLTAIRNLAPANDQRATTISKLFRKCCQDGQVDDLVIRRMQSSLSFRQLKEIFGDAAVGDDGQVAIDLLPAEWRCNLSAKTYRKLAPRTP